MHISDTTSKNNKTNYETKIFKVIETFAVDKLHALNLDIFTSYALKGPFLIKESLGILSRVLKDMAKMQFEEAIQ